jgi:anti-sigma factor RsiW
VPIDRSIYANEEPNMTRHTHTPAECRQLLGQLNEYVDGELADILCDALESHLDGCADCQVVLDSLTKTITLYRGLREVPMELPPDVEMRLMRRLEQDVHTPDG